MRLLAHIPNHIQQCHNPHDPLIIPNKDSNIFIIIFTDVYCQMAHLILSVFFSFSFYTYKDQSKFIFKTSRQQTTSTVASFFHHLFIDNLTFLEPISPRAADCVWPRTRILACLLFLVIGYREEHKLLDRYISISILLNQEKVKRGAACILIRHADKRVCLSGRTNH
jgi:hypothetical protein